MQAESAPVDLMKMKNDLVKSLSIPILSMNLFQPQTGPFKELKDVCIVISHKNFHINGIIARYRKCDSHQPNLPDLLAVGSAD
jgi:hypothetical protein